MQDIENNAGDGYFIFKKEVGLLASEALLERMKRQGAFIAPSQNLRIENGASHPSSEAAQAISGKLEVTTFKSRVKISVRFVSVWTWARMPSNFGSVRTEDIGNR